ncbi:MAG: hypothetical protein ABI433_13430 [Burkholderiaceae bacterium]
MNTPEAGQSGQSALDGMRESVHRPGLEADILAGIGLRLDDLPPRQRHTLEMALQRLAPNVKRARSKGYNDDEIAAELTPELAVLGLTVSGRSLARLLPRKKAVRKAV